MFVYPEIAMFALSAALEPNARSANRLCPLPDGLSSGPFDCTWMKYVPAGTVPGNVHSVDHCRNSEATWALYPGAASGTPQVYCTTLLAFCLYALSAVSRSPLKPL